MFQVNLTHMQDTVDISEYSSNGEWSLLKTEATTTYAYHDENAALLFPKVGMPSFNCITYGYFYQIYEYNVDASFDSSDDIISDNVPL